MQSTRSELKKVVVKCYDFKEICHTIDFFIKRGFIHTWRAEEFATYFWVGINNNGRTQSFSNEDSVSDWFANNFIANYEIIHFDHFFSGINPNAPDAKLTNEQINKVLSLLKEKRAFNGDSAYKAESLEINSLFYRLYKEKLIEEYGGKYFSKQGEKIRSSFLKKKVQKPVINVAKTKEFIPEGFPLYKGSPAGDIMFYNDNFRTGVDMSYSDFLSYSADKHKQD